MRTRGKREAAASSSLSPLPAAVSTPIAKKRKTTTSTATAKPRGGVPEPTDEFQQVTKPTFVDRYRLTELGCGGDVFYQPDFIKPDEAERWYQDVLDLDTCKASLSGPAFLLIDHIGYQPMLKMYGRTFPQSRQIAAYSTVPDATLKYSGSTIIMNHPLPPVLETIRARLEHELGVKFNHVMLNRYDDGNIYIGRHSDNLNNLVIASVSLGAERTFIMSPRLPSRAGAKTNISPKVNEARDPKLQTRQNVKWTLVNGSLVVMQGRTQEYWKHEIPKEPRIKTGRISLTFRQLV